VRNSIKRSAVAAFLLVTVIFIVTVTGCGQATGPGGTSVPVSASGATAIEGTPASPVPANPAPVTPAKQWVMPDLVGRGLQEAQDAMQKLTGNPLFITRSHDATGKKRNQVVDSNWQVCSQNIAPGGQVTGRSTVDFGAVKKGESCP
jgi:hypothetical protein